MGDRTILLVLAYLALSFAIAVGLYDRWADRRIVVFLIAVIAAVELGLRALGLHP